MVILGVETSCDETAIALIDVVGSKAKPRVLVLSNIVASQVKLHAKFGGVVPHLAKREHQRNLVPVLIQALRESGIMKHESRKRKTTPHDSRFQILDSILEREPELFEQMQKRVLSMKPPAIDAIAVTVGPGLAPALWVGVNFARALGYLWKKPIIPVNHLEGHILTNLLPQIGINPKSEARNPKSPHHPERSEVRVRDPALPRTNVCVSPRYRFGRRGILANFSPPLVAEVAGQIPNPKSQIQNTFEFRISNFEFPAIALLVSGGHTELVLMRGYGRYQVIGETLDDAAGEAFDKVAKMLELGFPGGPIISMLAERGNPRVFNFPRPVLHSKDFNFSFSGLKTAVLYTLRGLERVGERTKRDIAASFEQAVADVLVAKTIRAARQHRVKTVMIGGGVAANTRLRTQLGAALQRLFPSARYLVPSPSLTGDNALMVALAGWFNRGRKRSRRNLSAEANLRLDTKTPH